MLNLLEKAIRFLTGHRYTHDSLTDAQEAYTSTIDIATSDVYSQAYLIPTASLPFSGSGQNGMTQGVLKYWYRFALTPSNQSRDVWFFVYPSASNVGPQLITGSLQQTNFISPKYITPLQSQNNTENVPPGYVVTAFLSTSSIAPIGADGLMASQYAFDYKTGVLQFSSSVPAPNQYVFLTAYQYIGTTLDQAYYSNQISASNFSGSLTGTVQGTASYAISSSYAMTASFALNAGGSGIVSQSISSSWASSSYTASYVSGSGIGIFTGSFTGSFTGVYSGTLSGTASQAVSASWAPGGGTSLTTGSSYPITSSWAFNTLQSNIATSSLFASQSNFSVSSSWASSSLSASYISGSGTGSFYGTFTGTHSGSLFGTSSQAASASYVASASYYPFIGGTLSTGSTYPITASWANNAASGLYASQSQWSISSSFASSSISASLSQVALLSDAVLGLTIVDTPSVPNSSIVFGVSDHTNVGTMTGMATTNETHPHATIKVNNKLYGGGWDGNLFVVNDPDGNLQNITSASFIAGNYISQVAYSSGTGYLYFICGNNTGANTGSIVKVNPSNITSQSIIVQGLPGSQNLPGIAADANYLYTIPNDGYVYKFDANTGAQINKVVTSGISHAGGVFSPDGQFVYFSAGSKVTKVNTSNLSSSVNPVALAFTFDGINYYSASVVDDMAYLNGYLYAGQDQAIGNFGLWKVNANDLSWTPYTSNTNWSPSGSWAYPTEYGGYGVYTDGQNLYVLQGNANEIWVYLNGNLDNGPIRFAITGNPNEMWITNGGNLVYTNWSTNQIYRCELPIIEVGINKYPGSALDVAGTLSASAIYTPSLSASSIYTPTFFGNNTTFSASLSNVGQTFYVDAVGNEYVTTISTSNATPGVTVYGTASWAVNTLTASYIKGSGSFSGNLTGTASWANNSTTASYISGSGTGSFYGLFVGVHSGSLFGTASQATSASYSLSASWAPQPTISNSSSWASSSLSSSYLSGSATGSFTGLFYGTLTGSAISASYALSSSYALFALSSSYSVSSSWSITASYVSGAFIIVGTASYAYFAGTASWANNVLASGVIGTVTSASYALSSSYTLVSTFASQSSYATLATSASWASSSISSSFLNGTGSGSFSGSLFGSFIGSFLGNLVGTASWANNSIQSAFASSSLFATSASWASSSLSSSYLSGSGTGSFSGFFFGVYTGSLYGTASQAVSSSYVVSSSYAATCSVFFSTSIYVQQLNTTNSIFSSQSIFATQSLFAISASWASSSLSSSYWSGSGTGSFSGFHFGILTGSVFGTSSYAVTSSYLVYPSLLAVATNNATTSLFYQTASIYNSIFMNYILSSGQNYRAGSVMVLYTTASSVNTEVSTTDIGNTDGVTFMVTMSNTFVSVSVANATANNFNVKYHYDIL